MHQCLQIAEIVSQIFSELDGHVYDTRMRFPTRIVHRNESTLRTLAGLARTCQAFKESALDVLWREIPDLFVLVKHLMPAELLKYDAASSVLFLKEEPHSDVWRVLDPYVARIRTVGIPPPFGVVARGLDPETVLRPLERHLARIAVDGDLLFPKLEHVVYQAFWAHELHSRLLLHRNLQVLQLPLMAYTSQWNLSPSATENMISSVSRSLYALSDHVRGALMKMCNLRTFWVRAALLDQPTFGHLGSLSTLTGLALEAGWGHVAYPPRTETGTRAFAALRELSVSIAHSDAPHFLAHIDPESLEALNIHWEYLYSDASSSGAVLQELFTALLQLPKISLKHVSVALDAEMEQMIHIADGGPDDSHSQRLKGLAGCSFDLEPVLSLTALRTLEIGIDVVFQVDDEFLMTLAENMPHLESLRLTPLLRGPFSFDCVAPVADELNSDILAIPNLDGLLAFSKRCSKLTTLRLAVRASLSGDSSSRLELNSIPPSCGVRTLELWTTALDPEVSDETFVAFIVGAFPSLEEFCAVLPISHPEHEKIPRTEARVRWGRVANNLSTSSSVHEQSAARARSVLWEVV